jgi:nitrate reductase assembly molybdenum cofactor insertion protein NarJ
MKTFDVQAVCYLDLGYLMFGEDYKRAQLLVHLQNEHVKTGVDCGTELADHLPNVLVLLARTEDPEFAEELGFVILSQAVRFMLTRFKNSDNLYGGFLAVLLEFLNRDFNGNGLDEYVFPEHVFRGDQEFLMPSPKQDICNTVCNKHNTYRK